MSRDVEEVRDRLRRRRLVRSGLWVASVASTLVWFVSCSAAATAFDADGWIALYAMWVLPVLFFMAPVVAIIAVVPLALSMNQLGPHQARGLLIQQPDGRWAERPPATDMVLVVGLLGFIALAIVSLLFVAILAPFGIACLLLPAAVVGLVGATTTRRLMVHWAREPLLRGDGQAFVARARRVRPFAGPRLGLALDAHVARVQHGVAEGAQVARSWFRRQWVRPLEEQEMAALVLEDLAERGDWQTVEAAVRIWVDGVEDAALMHRWLGRVLEHRGEVEEAQERMRLAGELDDRAGALGRRVDHRRDP